MHSPHTNKTFPGGHAGASVAGLPRHLLLLRTMPSRRNPIDHEAPWRLIDRRFAVWRLSLRLRIRIRWLLVLRRVRMHAGFIPAAAERWARPVPAPMRHRASQVLKQMWHGKPRPGADVAGESPVPVQMWQGAKSHTLH